MVPRSMLYSLQQMAPIWQFVLLQCKIFQSCVNMISTQNICHIHKAVSDTALLSPAHESPSHYVSMLFTAGGIPGKPQWCTEHIPPAAPNHAIKGKLAAMVSKAPL